MDSVKVFAPASVANVGPGYDVLGFCLEGIGDYLEVRKTDAAGIVIESIDGADLSLQPEENVVGVVLQSMMTDLGIDYGVSVKLEKGVMPGSGLGSSASSAAAAAVALNYLEGDQIDPLKVVEYAMAGEEFVSKKAHADNVAPSIYGGFTIVRGYDPLDVISVPLGKIPFVAIVHPQIEVKTAVARKLLKTTVDMEDAVRQMGNISGLITGLCTGDFEVVARSMEDRFAVPTRSLLIPYYQEVEKIAMGNGAFAFSISGSGPSMFALCEESETAEVVCQLIQEVYSKAGIESKTYVSRINSKGAEIVK